MSSAVLRSVEINLRGDGLANTTAFLLRDNLKLRQQARSVHLYTISRFICAALKFTPTLQVAHFAELANMLEAGALLYLWT